MKNLEVKSCLARMFDGNIIDSHNKSHEAVNRLKYLLQSTDYTCDEFKYWSMNTSSTITDVIDAGASDSQMYNTVGKRIRNDIAKIDADIGGCTIERLINGQMSKIEVVQLIFKLDNMINGNHNIIDQKYIVNLIGDGKKCAYIDQEKFDREFEKVNGYKKDYVERLKIGLDKEFKQYIRYLITNVDKIKGVDLENYYKLFG